MKNRLFNIRSIFALMLLGLAVPLVYAGGPLLVNSAGQPVRWARNEIRGGPLNSATVDAQGRVLYRVDSGTLGPLSNEQAKAFVDRIFKQYTDIDTATIEYVNAGPILDPATAQPVDVNGGNVGRFLSSQNPTFQNPIVFDSDGSITGGGGVLGFFTFLQLDQGSNSLREGTVVLNGRVLTTGLLSTTSFLGVFTHEFGHFAGPLDHAQINGNIALDGEGAVIPPGFDPNSAYDLYAPFTETLFPFLFDAPFGSQLRNQFDLEDSGFFIASLDLDTKNALSNLYPTNDYMTSRGSIRGRVLIRAGATDIPVTGINVIARRINQGTYPPLAGTPAFPTLPIQFDPDGVPLEQTDPATDSLMTVSSAVTGLDFGPGTYQIQGLPPGQYLIEIQTINPDALRGSGIGPLGAQIPLPVQEFYNGANESNGPTDDPSEFVAVTVNAGGTTSNIDIILNGFSNAPVNLVNEIEPNQKAKKGQRLNTPVELSAAAASTDPAKFKMNLGDGLVDKIEDLYRFTVETTGTFFVLLDATSGQGDLDLYVFSSGVANKKSSLFDPNLLDLSVGSNSSEVIAIQLTPGAYVVGVSAFSGNQSYKLRIIPPQ
jgi:hypothetical protein